MSNCRKKLLNCAFLLLIVNVGYSLKLTPVHNLAQKLDLEDEAQIIALAFSEATAELSFIDQSGEDYLLNNKIIKKLRSTIERWHLVEDRLRDSISNIDISHQVIAIIRTFFFMTQLK